MDLNLKNKVAVITGGSRGNPLSPPPLRSKGGFKALPPRANS
ncbi:MAG: hypothetical protein ACJAQT_002874 [Akkermansiaceae bacterium]|jgi:hypothetical protein